MSRSTVIALDWPEKGDVWCSEQDTVQVTDVLRIKSDSICWVKLLTNGKKHVVNGRYEMQLKSALETIGTGDFYFSGSIYTEERKRMTKEEVEVENVSDDDLEAAAAKYDELYGKGQ